VKRARSPAFGTGVGMGGDIVAVAPVEKGGQNPKSELRAVGTLGFSGDGKMCPKRNPKLMGRHGKKKKHQGSKKKI